MAWFAFFVLVTWLPTVFFLFEKYSITKAIVFAFVAAWLFLPPTQIPLSGFPDWSKMTATSVSVSLCVCLKRPGPLLAIRPRWYDLPVVAYCSIPFISSINNGLGAYDGLSAVLDEVVRWGIPYFVGRAYLGTVDGNRQLSLGIATGGLLYVPLCLLEIRLSPQLKSWVYGFYDGRAVDFGFRYGGYRPLVFLSTGLELGWWMCCSTFAAFMLWKSGSVRRVGNYPLSMLTAILAAVTVACKSTGALVQIAIGFFIVFACRRTKSTVLLWALMAIGPLYCINRPLGTWDGSSVVAWADSIFGGDRAESLGFRFASEEVLIRSAMQRPIFGWGRSGGFNPPDATGKTAVTDGLWIIVFGWMGMAGLTSLNAMLLTPTIVFLRRYQPRTWFDPDVAPLATLAIILPLFMIDNLSNAMLNPIYSLAMGSIVGCKPRRRPFQSFESSSNLAGDDFVESPQDLLNPNRRLSSQDEVADRAEREANVASQSTAMTQARVLYDRAIGARQLAYRSQAAAWRLDRLARTHAAYARFLTTIGEHDAAIAERKMAMAAWKGLAESIRLSVPVAEAYAANLNDLAWLLLGSGANASRIQQAIELVEEAIGVSPGQSTFWNTLGIGRFRRGDYYKSLHALSQAVSRASDGGNAFDFYYLAMANSALGYIDPAQAWINRADSWAKERVDLATLLQPLREEAHRLLSTAEALKPSFRSRLE